MGDLLAIPRQPLVSRHWSSLGELKAQILEESSYCSQLEIECHKAQAIVDALALRLNHFRAAVASKNNLLQPVNRLPVEILGEIFVHWAEAQHRESDAKARPAVLVASSVSRHWREVTQQTPRLWRYICLDLHNGPTALRAAEIFLSRSGACAVDVRLRNIWRPAELPCSETIQTLASRRPWRSFSASINSLHGEIPEYLRGPTPSLEELSLDASPARNHREHTPGKFLPDAPLLQRLSLTDYHSWKWTWSTLPSLRTLVLRSSPFVGKFAPRALARILACCPALEDLELELFLDASNPAEPLTLPNLQKLSISSGLCRGAKPLSSWLVMPALQSLRAYKFETDGDCALLYDFVASLPKTLAEVQIEGGWLGHEARLRRAFRHLTELRSLRIHDTWVMDDFARAFITPSGSDGPICPSLSSIHFTAVSFLGAIDIASWLRSRLMLAKVVGGPAHLQRIQIERCDGFSSAEAESLPKFDSMCIAVR